MPASVARAAICSAPLEWPSRPGLPIRNLIRRPSLRDTRSISPRSASRPAASCLALGETPVGARNSPNSKRNASPHSPVVTPASAASIEAGMIFAPLAAATRNALQRQPHPRFVARRAPSLQLFDLLRLRFGGRNHDGVLARSQRRGLRVRESIDADNNLFAPLDGLQGHCQTNGRSSAYGTACPNPSGC